MIKIPIILEIDDRQDESPIKVNKNYNGCSHSIIIDDHLKTITCGKCGRVFEHWEFIMKIGTEFDNEFRRRMEAATERKKIEKDILKIKRQLRNEKAKLRRISGQVAMFNSTE
jgi:ribosomal protein S27AE